MGRDPPVVEVHCSTEIYILFLNFVTFDVPFVEWRTTENLANVQWNLWENNDHYILFQHVVPVSKEIEVEYFYN